MKPNLENWKAVTFGEKETQILEAYLDVAQKEGLEQVTLQKVAKQAKIPYATVHYYFGNSERTMIENAVIYVGVASEKFIDETLKSVMLKSGENAVKAYIEAKFKWNELFPKYASLWCYFIYQTTRDENYRKLHAHFFQGNYDRVKTLFLLEIGKGTYKGLSNLDSLSEKVYQTIMGGMVLSMSTALSSKDLKAHKQKTLAIFDCLIEEHWKRKEDK